MNLSLFIPELILAGAAILVILLDLFVRQTAVLRWAGLAALVASAGTAIAMWNGGNGPIFNQMLAVDNFAVFFKVLFAGIAFMVVLASSGYDEKFSRFRGEYYALILIATLGMMLMASTTDLIAVYISLELTSISLYILVSFLKDRQSTEASLKYLLLGATASAVLLYGMAFVFGSTGQTQLVEIARAVNVSGFSEGSVNPALMLGIVFMIAGFGFKIAAVPFHMWVPDVYEGAPTTITAFLSVGSKAAGFAMILRVFVSSFGGKVALLEDWGMIFAVLAVLSMVVGNVSAIPQNNIKRMLGYSSIAQAGYLMVGLAATGAGALGLKSSIMVHPFQAQSSIIFFLAAYALTNLAAFVTVIVISSKINSDGIDDYAGMGKRSPWLALALTLALVSLTGIPPAAGFMGKFYVFSAAAGSDLLWLVVVAAINSVISAYYYLRVVKVMWFNEAPSTEKIRASALPAFAVFLCSLGVLLLGIIPGAVMRLVEYAAMMVSF